MVRAMPTKYYSTWAPLVVVVLAFAASCILFLLVLNALPFKVCVPVEPGEVDRYQKAIAALDSIVDLSIKLSTALVGLGAAILIGLKSGVRLTPAVRSLILVSAICFLQSALYAVWWRMGVAELWLNECLALISEPRLTAKYAMHFYFFIAGLIALAIIILGAVLVSPSPDDKRT